VTVATVLGDRVIPARASRSSRRGRRSRPVAVGLGIVACAQALLLQTQHDNTKALLLLLDVTQVVGD
jgi:hypothetical protein